MVIFGKARGGFAVALFGLCGYGGKVLRQNVKILRRGGRRRVSSFLPARPDAATGFRPPARLGRQDKRLGICSNRRIAVEFVAAEFCRWAVRFGRGLGWGWRSWRAARGCLDWNRCRRRAG